MGPYAALGTTPAKARATPPNIIAPAAGQPRMSKDGNYEAAPANGRPLRESVPAGGPPPAKCATALCDENAAALVNDPLCRDSVPVEEHTHYSIAKQATPLATRRNRNKEA